MYKIILMNTTEGRVWAEVYLDRISHNYKLIKQKVERAEIMAAIKADAYGHGAVEVARTLEAEGIYMFGVASLEEGIELRKAGITSKILVLSPIIYSQIDALLEYNLIPTISELGFFKLLDKKLRVRQKPMVVHIEVDTGMTRTGIPYRDAHSTIQKIDTSPFITIEGIFSHFPLADADGSFTKKQIEEFNDLIKNLKRVSINPHFVHIANSAGIFRYGRSHFNLVRPGIALYGLNSSPEVNFAEKFLPAMVLKSRVVNLRKVSNGTAVSYGHTYKTKRKSIIATVSVGYGDGYPRALSNCGEVLINGVRAPIIGTVCMDLIMIDVTDIKGVKVGDIVTLIGKDGCEMVTAEECAVKSNTIVYEITSGIGPRVARVFKVRDRVISVRNLLGRWRNGG
jgi:alanine racemase